MSTHTSHETGIIPKVPKSHRRTSQFMTEFLIIIPTRNRSKTLPFTIESAISQSHSRLSIVILDNASTDGTLEVASAYALKDKRISVSRASHGLSMVDNWERGIGNAINPETFVTFIGDDDSFVPGALSAAEKILKSQPNLKVLSWKKAEYCWPDVALTDMKNYLEFNVSEKAQMVDSRSFLRSLHEFECGYDQGPSIYSSFVRGSLLLNILASDGVRFFRSSSPDVYSAIILAAYSDHYLSCKFPLSINGASKSSNGIAQTNNIKNEESERFANTNDFHPLIRSDKGKEQPITVGIAEADSLATAHDHHKRVLSEYSINHEKLANRLNYDLSLLAVGSSAGRGLMSIILRLTDQLAEENLGKGYYKRNSGFKTGIKPSENGFSITADLIALDIENAWQAGKYIATILNLESLRVMINAAEEPSALNSRASLTQKQAIRTFAKNILSIARSFALKSIVRK